MDHCANIKMKIKSIKNMRQKNAVILFDSDNIDLIVRWMLVTSIWVSFKSLSTALSVLLHGINIQYTKNRLFQIRSRLTYTENQRGYGLKMLVANRETLRTTSP